MKITKIQISNLFGVTETELDGKSIEVTGEKGTGKTSLIDAIRYALKNSSHRETIVRQGATAGQILIETDVGLTIERQKNTTKADSKKITQGKERIQNPESFLKTIFTPLQINPIEFSQMTSKEQNRILLDLIDFQWDLNWINQKFGEIPKNIDYEQNILRILHDIQDIKGNYYQTREDINRDIRNNKAFITEIAEDIPEKYDAKRWENFELSSHYSELAKIKKENNEIERAVAFKNSYKNKLRGLEANKQIDISTSQQKFTSEKTSLEKNIERLKNEIKLTEEKLNSLDSKETSEIQMIEERFNAQKEKLDNDTQIASTYTSKELVDTNYLEQEIATAEKMKLHLNEYNRMNDLQRKNESFVAQSEELTQKIELARNLPGEILKNAKMPVKNLTVVNGIPLINGLTVSDLSTGECIELCVDVTISNTGNLQIILLDGLESLSEKHRNILYKKCQEKGLQFIATRTTDENELKIIKF